MREELVTSYALLTQLLSFVKVSEVDPERLQASKGSCSDRSRIQSCSPQHLLMKLTVLPVCKIFIASSLLKKDGIITQLSEYFCVHSLSSVTFGSVSIKNSLKGSLISPSIIQVLIIVSTGAETSFRILLMNCLVLGLPLSANVLMAEQMAPPFKFEIESTIRASHFIRSKGS